MSNELVIAFTCCLIPNTLFKATKKRVLKMLLALFSLKSRKLLFSVKQEKNEALRSNNADIHI